MLSLRWLTGRATWVRPRSTITHLLWLYASAMPTMVHEPCQAIFRLPRPSEVHSTHLRMSNDSDNACAKIGRSVAVGVGTTCDAPDLPRTVPRCLGSLGRSST